MMTPSTTPTIITMMLKAAGYGEALKKIGDFFHCGKSCNPD